jgi:iron complex transport system substrate-binding protein
MLNYGQLALAVSLVDSRNRTVSLETAPQRIATGFVGADEIVFELLQRSKSPARLIAVSTLAGNSEYSAIAGQVDKIPGRVGSELETLVAMKPDLVILASFNRPEMILQLDHLGIKTFVLGSFAGISDISLNIEIIGKLLFLQPEAKILASEFTNGLDRIKKQQQSGAQKPRIISWFSDGSAMGKGTLVDDMITGAGGNNILSTELGIKGWATVSDEKIPLLSPDWIICAGEESEKGKTKTAILQNHSWAQLKAAKDGKLIMIPSRFFSSASHHVLKAVEIVAAQVQADSLRNGRSLDYKR